MAQLCLLQIILGFDIATQICLRTTVFYVFKVSTAVSNAEVIYHDYFRNNANLKVSQFSGVLIFETCLFSKQCLLLRMYGIC